MHRRRVACAVRATRPIPAWALVSTAWIVPALLAALDNAAQSVIWGDPIRLRAVLFTGLDWLLYGFLTPPVFWLARRFPLSRPRLARNAVLHLAFSLAFCVAWASGGTVLRALLQPKFFDGGVLRGFASWVFITLPFGVAVYLAVVGVEHAIRYFVEAREREAQLARVSEQLTAAKLSALQAQLNPHFLFNSLNTIGVLVRDNDNAAATRILHHLSSLLRRTLSRTTQNEVALDDELDLVRQYVAVQEARFADRLRVELEVPADVRRAAVPVFAVQHLVENAVRHGIGRRTKSGRVGVAARRDGDMLEVTVTDDGAGFPADAPVEAGHGLENTRERLRTLYGDRASLDVRALDPHGGGTIARLRVPYHELPTTPDTDA
jgi:two-component system LytT family sensor kinase